ncbi:MAG: hypothetical protein Q9161_009253 [Pseudevernia consocians]
MSSSQASSRSPGEESYYTAEEDHHSNAQGSSEASSTTITTPKENSDSVYATAIQTPTASPGMNKATDQDSFEALRRIEESPEERRERNLLHVTAAPSFTHRAEASTHLEKQRALDMQQARMEEPDIDMVEYGISALMPEKEESVPDLPTEEVLDNSSLLWPSLSVLGVNDGRPANLTDAHQSNYLESREASDFSYTYRPMPIDVDTQQHNFLSSSLGLNNTSTVESNCTTDTHQGLASIERNNEMPYDPSGRFIMNPKAPAFVPRQGPRPAITAPNPRDSVYYGVPRPKQGLAIADPTNTPNIGPSHPKVQLFGSGHGMFFDPSTGLFTGDGAPRKSPYRADGTLPSQPEPESDFLTRQQYPEPAEDQLHIQSKREYTKRMANFGKNGPIQTFRVGRPVPQGNQQATRVMVRKNEEGGVPLGRRVDTEDDDDDDRMEGEGGVQAGSVYITDEMEANLKRLMGITK